VPADEAGRPSRAAATRERLARRRRTAIAVGFAAVVSAALVAGVVALVVHRPSPQPAAPAPSAESRSAAVTPSADASASIVEVPAVEGMGLAEATSLLSAAGLTTEVSAEGTPVASARMVAKQSPAAGVLVAVGGQVRLTVPPAVTKTKAKKATKATHWVVCIDPGHQAHSNNSPEPIGPGATTLKARVTGGTTGVSTGVPEYEIALEIAMNLKKRLEASGITVVMTRLTNDVDIPNSSRAGAANDAGADIFVRIHTASSTDPALTGVATQYPASNAWTKAIVEPSRAAAESVESALVRATGATDRGVSARGDLAGFNWAKVPSVLVETGYQSNRVEDELLASPRYQDKVAEGVARGIMSYLQGRSQ
jgi:N-acetylmuramoyl-L-alanine amidase